MKSIRIAVLATIVIGLAGCDSEPEPVPVMPDVVGQALDVSLSDIERAGVDDEVEVVGGGALGIIDESNWQVCEQLPAAGESVTDAPRLTVDRSCDDGAIETTSPPTDIESTPSEQPSTEPIQEPQATESQEPQATESVGSSAAEPVTADNNEDLAALLEGPGECDDPVARFAAEYRGRVIEFDGNIAFMANHDDYDTRYDMLIYVGDYSETGNPGPSFQLRDVNFADLNFADGDAPDFIGQGDNLVVTATVEEFTEGCLLRLDPVSTAVR